MTSTTAKHRTPSTAVADLRANAAPGVTTVGQRFVLSGVSLLALAVGLLGLAAQLDGLRLVGLLVYCLVGIGSAPWAADEAMRLPLRVSVTFVTGMAVLVLGSLTMMLTGLWQPWAAFSLVALVTALLHVRGLRRAWPAVAGHPWHLDQLVRSPAVICATVGALCCLTAALTHRHITPGEFGFLTQIGPLWYAGVLLVLLGVALARDDDERHLAIAVTLLTVVVTLTPSLVYDGPRSQAAGKHVDFISQIRTLHRIDTSVAIYDAWSGFFGAMAWLCDVTGIRDPMRLATFWPALLGVFRSTALRHLFGQVTRTRYQAWIGVALAVLADPIGADYFSPQSVGFVTGVVAFGLALSSWRRDLRLVMLTVAGATVAVSHQLSPYVIGGVLCVLVVFRRVRPWWTPACILVPAVLWALIHFDAVSSFITFSDIGQAQNFRPPKTQTSGGLDRLPIVGQTVLALLVCIGVVGLLALAVLIRRRRDPAAWALAVCPAVGLVLVAVNPYGQEGIFRAALFGLPWLAALAAGLFAPHAHLRRRLRLPLLATCLVLTTAFGVASFGLDVTNVLRPGDLQAFRYFRAQGGDDASSTYYLLNLGIGDLPSSPPAQAGTHLSLGRDDLRVPVRQEAHLDAANQVRVLTTRMVDYAREPADQAHLYALWSPVQAAYAEEYGIQRPDQFTALRDAFRASPSWTVVFDHGGTMVFRFVSSGSSAR